MEIIKSKENVLYKQIKSLKEHNGRKQQGCYIIEGQKMISEAIAAGAVLQTIVVAESKQNQYKDFAENKNCRLIADALFDKLSDTVTPQGILAVVNIPEHKFVFPDTNFIVLDRLRDPANLASIIRTAAATGFKYIYLIDCVDQYSPKVVRGTMSGMFFSTIINCTLNQALTLKNPSFKLVATSMDGQSIYATVLQKKYKYGIIIGNEANGICQELLSEADYKLSLPMQNMESLNAAVCAGVFMYQIWQGACFQNNF